MTGPLVTVVGLEEVQRMLRDAPRAIVATGFTRALSAAANVMADAVEARTPIKSEHTGGILNDGELRESIMIQVELDSNFRGGVAWVGFGKNGVVANWVEYGHSILGRGEKKRKGGEVKGEVRPHPFIRPAFDQSAEAAVAAFTASLSDTVRSLYGE